MVKITKLNMKSDWTKCHTNCQMSVRGYCHIVQWVLMAAEHCGQYVLATIGTIEKYVHIGLSIWNSNHCL